LESKAPVYRIVIAQVVVTILATLVLLAVDIEKAYSVFFGGITCVLPSWFMAWRLGKETADPAKALKTLVRGEMGKLFLTAVIFSAVFYWVKPLNVAFYFMAIVLVMLLNVFVPLFEVLVNARKAKKV